MKMDPRNKELSVDEQTVEILEIIEDVEDYSDLDSEYSSEYYVEY